RRPHSRGKTDRRRFTGRECDVGQRVVAPRDAITRFFVVRAVGARLQRDAEVAKVFLVPLEHALERIVGWGLVVAGNELADPLGSEIGAGVQEADDEVEQPLRPPRRHDSPRYLRRSLRACFGGGTGPCRVSAGNGAAPWNSSSRPTRVRCPHLLMSPLSDGHMSATGYC